MTKRVLLRSIEDWNKLVPSGVPKLWKLFRDDGGGMERSERCEAGGRCHGRLYATGTRTAPGYRRRSSGGQICAWLLLSVAVLFAGSAQAEVLVSNLNKSNDSGLSTGGTAGNTRFTHAIRFTTGSNEDGYTLTSVKLVLENASNPDGVRVQIYSESSGVPDSSVYTLVNPTISNGTNTFTAPAGSTLDKSTKYFVVFDSTATGGQYNVRATNSDTLTGMADGWTLNTDRHTQSTSNTNWTTHSAVPRVEINGTVDTDATVVPANWELLPSGLSADDQFRLIFVSSSRRDGTSSTIGDYDTHVQTAAASGHDALQSYSSQFKALGCTTTTDARDHTETTYTATEKGVPIYWLDGDKVADDYEDFYDGNWDDNFPKNENGANGSTTSGFAGGVFTGCESDGTADSGNALGDASPIEGRPGHDGLEIKNVTTSQSNSRKVYGLSVVFQVSDVSADATLTDLDLTWNDGGTATDIALFPTFAKTSTNYTARVATSVSRITIAPTLGDSNAGVDYLDDSDQTLSDADSDPATGFQVDLSTGANTIKVKVTAEDLINTETYTVTVIRAAQASGSEIWSGVLTVGKLGDVDDQATGYCDTASGRCIGDPFGALSDDDFNLDGTDFTVESIRWSGDVNTDRLHLTLDADFPAASLPGLVLRVGANDFLLGDAGRGNNLSDVQNNYRWSPFSSDIFKLETDDTIAVKLFEAPAPTADADAVNADLSDLELSWDDGGTATAIDLSPGFSSAIGTYTATAVSTASRITVNPTKVINGAGLGYFDGNGNQLSDADSDTANGFQVDLNTGENDVHVKVTATDGDSSRFYKVVVTRVVPIVVGYEPATYEVTEGGVSVTLTIKTTSHPDDGAPRPFRLLIHTADDSAISPGDYGGVSGQLILFNTGDVTQTHIVTIVDDTFLEDNERFESTISLSSGVDVAVSPTTASVIIEGRDATGTPVVTGVPQVGQTLAAGIGDVADDDTRPANFPDDYTFQWVRTDADDTNPVDIASETSATYSLAAADVGKKLRVKVGFTDGGGAEERLESDSTTVAVAAQADCTMDRPDANWCAEMTVGKNIGTGGAITLGYTALGTGFGTLSDTTIDYGGGSTAVRSIYLITTSDAFSLELGAFVSRGSTFNLGGQTVTASAGSEQMTTGVYSWNAPAGYAWIEDQKVTVSANLTPIVTAATVAGDQLTLTFAEDLDTNSKPAASAFTVYVDGDTTGVNPSSVDTVSGNTVTMTMAIAVTGAQTLTLDYTPPTTNRLRDESELDAPGFTGQTVTNNTDDTTPPEVTGATVDGSTLVITFDETLAVAANLINSAFAVKKTPDGGSEEAVTLTGSPSISDATVTLTLATAVSSTDADVKVSYTKPTTGTDNALKDGNDNDVADFADQAVTNITDADNNEPEGKPTITGPAQVGMTLTAETDGITDADGTDDATFTYRWNIYGSDIAGATGASYTLTQADQESELRVVVEFTDDLGNAESVTSDPTSTVVPAAAPNCGARRTVWCTVLTAGHGLDGDGDVHSAGYSAGNYGSLEDATFTHDGVQYTVTKFVSGGTSDLILATTPTLPTGNGLAVHVQRVVGEVDLPLDEAELEADGDWYFRPGCT